MVWSCGMNGRSRESRPSGSGGQTSKKSLSTQNQRTAHKPKASAEAIQMARILEDPGRVSEVNSKVTSVLTVVPGCTEEQVHLALHDNNYDLDKTISALLDSDGVPNQGEWTTTTSSRKGRKKGTAVEEQSKTNTGRTTTRSASSGTRESYGGSVTVSGSTGSGGRTGQRQTAGRGRGQSAGKRVRSGAGVGEQRRPRQRDKDKDKLHNTTQGPAAPNKASSEEWDSLPAVTTTERKERSSDDWGREGDIWQQAALTEQLWEPVQQSVETGVQLQTREASLEQAQDPGLEQSRDIGLELPDSGMLEETSDFGEPGFEEITNERNEPNSVFPEAIPGGQALMHSTQSEITPTALVSTGDRGQALTHMPSESREKVISRKPRRLARSQIPTKPVEMPAGIESLDVQFGELGIDFVGLESGSPPPPPEQSSDVSLSLSASAAGGDQLSTADNHLTYSQLQHRYEDGSVSVSMSTSSSSAGGGGSGLGGGEGPSSRALLQLEPSAYSESGGAMVSAEDVSSGGGGGGLRSPPGLPHPVASAGPAVVSEAGQYGSSTTTTGDSTINDQTAGGVALGGASSSQQSPSEAQLHLQSDVSPPPTVKPTPMELPIELTTRKSQPANQQTSTTTGPIEHTPFSSVANSGSGKFSSSVTASTSASSLSSSVSSRAVSAVSGHTSSSLSNQHHQHHQTQQQQQGKLSGSSVPPGMLYPHMMPAQYPFIPAVNPAMYNYDPNDMSRYSSGSMAYFPTSTDPTMGGAIPSRDHTSSAFQAQAEQAKYAPPRGGASDLGSAVTVSSTQQTQQQQGGNLQQAAAAAASGAQQMGPYMGTHHFYGNMFYPAMYGPMPAFSQAANFGGFGSYEDMLAAAGGQASHDYSKMYAATANSLSKQPSSTSTAPIDSSAALAAQASTSFKHHDTSKQFSYSVPGGVGGSQAPTAAPQYYMQMPFPPMMVGPGADVGGVAGGVAPHSRISQQKHSSKVGGGVGYQGNSGASYWSSTAAHSS